MKKQKLYIHVGRATHFLSWELPEFKKYFTLVDQPSEEVALLSFGPDVLKEAAGLPARKRFAVLFPGFGRNPVYNISLKREQRILIENKYECVFINPGPLQIAYRGLDNVYLYPFSVNVNIVNLKNFRNKIDSLLHVSNDGPQKDWARSEMIMKNAGLPYEVYPPRDNTFFDRQLKQNERKNRLRRLVGVKEKSYLPRGYVNHKLVVKKYQQYDGFVHVARNIKDPVHLDGKYTASLIEAGITGAILFWHDTFNLGNDLETVFNLPLDPDIAAKMILDIRGSINVESHSKKTREEMLDTFQPSKSVQIRAEKILQSL